MKRYIKSDNYDEYREIISMLKSAQTYEDMKKIDKIIQTSSYADDARKGIDDNDNYITLQIFWNSRLRELGL